MPDKLSDEKINQLRDCFRQGLNGLAASLTANVTRNCAYVYYRKFREEGLTQSPPEMQPEPVQEAHELEAEVKPEPIQEFKLAEASAPVSYLQQAAAILAKMPIGEFVKLNYTTQDAVKTILSINELQEVA